MHNRVFDKSKLPSRDVTEGTSRAPHHSYICATALIHKQSHQPLAGFLGDGCVTAAGGTVNDNLRKVVWNADGDVIWPAAKPITATGGVIGLRGSLAPEGAIVMIAGMPEAGLTFRGPALCFDLLVEDLELEKSKKDWRPRKTNFGSGALWKYAQSVGPAARWR
jgi:hypothetical protein